MFSFSFTGSAWWKPCVRMLVPLSKVCTAVSPTVQESVTPPAVPVPPAEAITVGERD